MGIPFNVTILGISVLFFLAYADDIGGGAKLNVLKKWWRNIEVHGPKFGYHPKVSKSWLVVKEEKYQEALNIFADTEIKVTTKGRKYLRYSLDALNNYGQYYS